MANVKELEQERTAIMAQTLTHVGWVKAMERLAEISAEILLIKNTQEEYSLPPLATEEQRAAARIKLIRINQFRKTINHATI